MSVEALAGVKTGRYRYRYRLAQRVLHWTMAIVIISALALGLWCAYLQHGSAEREFLMQIHKSLGMTALALIVMRIPTRVALGEPEWHLQPSAYVRLGSHVAHGLLYALMVLMPVAGYIAAGGHGRSIPWFGLFDWPNIVPADARMAHIAATVHTYGAYAFFCVLGLHLAAVAWHRLIRKDEVLSRML